MNIYKNNNTDIIDNNKEYCYLKNNILEKINEIFKDNSKLYKYKVSIKTKNKDYNTYIIGKNDEYLVTFKDEKIYIKDIISIEK